MIAVLLKSFHKPDLPMTTMLYWNYLNFYCSLYFIK